MTKEEIQARIEYCRKAAHNLRTHPAPAPAGVDPLAQAEAAASKWEKDAAELEKLLETT